MAIPYWKFNGMPLRGLGGGIRTGPCSPRKEMQILAVLYKIPPIKPDTCVRRLLYVPVNLMRGSYLRCSAALPANDVIVAIIFPFLLAPGQQEE